MNTCPVSQAIDQMEENQVQADLAHDAYVEKIEEEFKNLEVGDYIVALGDMGEAEIEAMFSAWKSQDAVLAMTLTNDIITRYLKDSFPEG